MNIFKRILVGLDISEMDPTLLEYTAMIADTFEVDMIYFIHVAKSLELPDEVVEKYPDLLAPVDETIEREINVLLGKHFKPKSNVEYKIIVKEGSPEDQILKWAKIKAIDLMVMGRKRTLKGSGTLTSQLAKVGPCSVLMIPEFSESKIDRIMVPVDFSEYSRYALIEAVKLKDSFNAELLLQNTYRVPVGYHTSGKSYEEFADIMKGHAKKDADKFLKKNSLSEKELDVILTLDDNDEPADKIYEEANIRRTDLVVIASRGRTGLASILLGSVADKMCQYSSNIPLLIVKNKDENMGFLEALLKV